MSDDYLWDRSGPPDPEIERLERALAPLRYRHRQPVRRTAAWAAAAAILLAAAAAWQFREPQPQPTAWAVSGNGARVRIGQTVRTVASGLTLESSEIGRVDLGPGSELRATGERSLQLNRGILHAFIWAPPREFVVDTPSSRAVDLGCEYTLDVNPSGGGLLKVSMGWVAFEFRGRESFIPEGAQCATSRQRGPGLPFYSDAPEALQQAVARGDVGAILAAARPRDGLTLWHLLTRVPAAERAAVYDRFAQLVELPPQVSREAVLRGDPKMIDLCWNALNLENTGWWRGWERRWSE